MTVKIGIPRALLFYNFIPFWKTFFSEIGAETVVSGHTNKAILHNGLRLSVDESCLPVKVAFGHIESLKNRVDYLFIPRLVSIFPREYICPKFLGFPDMVRQNVDGLPQIIDTSINMYRRERDMYRQFYQIGSRICGNPVKIALALKRATEEMKRFTARVESGIHPDKAAPGGNCPGQVPRQLKRAWVAVIGHPYNVYDGFINIGLLKRLDQAGIGVLTADNVPAGVVDHHASALNKKLFWTLGKRMVGAAYHFLEDPAISGIIHVASFACGPDSMTGEIIERRARQAGAKPYLNLTLDEHTGEAGIVTRIEAFLDMVGLHEQAAEGT